MAADSIQVSNLDQRVEFGDPTNADDPTSRERVTVSTSSAVGARLTQTIQDGRMLAAHLGQLGSRAPFNASSSLAPPQDRPETIALGDLHGTQGQEPPLTGPAYANAVQPTALQALHAIGAEAVAELFVSALVWGVTKTLSEAAAGRWLAQQLPDASPAERGALQAVLAGPALAASLFVGATVISPAVKSVLGAAVAPNEGAKLFPDGADAADVMEVRSARDRLEQTQAAGRIGTFFGDLTALVPFGLGYATLGVTRDTSLWAGTLTGGLAGAVMAGTQAAIALRTRCEGMGTHHTAKPPAVPQAIKEAFQNIMVVATPEGGKTQSLAWRTRNLVQEFTVECLASIAGMLLANAYAAYLERQGPSESDAQTFLRGLGGVYCTVGVFFFAIMPLGERRGCTDGVFGGFAGALPSALPTRHAGSTAKLFNLDPDGVVAKVTDALDGVHHTWRKGCALPAHLVLDALNLLTKPLHPGRPAPEGQLIDL